MRALLLIPTLATLLTPAMPPADAVQATDVWARATSPRQTTGAVYLTLTSPADDTLLTVSSTVAAQAQVHEMTMQGQVMRMRAVPGLDLPRGQPVTLKPGGLHVMLTDLKAPLILGQTFALHLTFQHSPPIDVGVRVAGVGASGPVMAH